jgi:hypothetical protein
MPIFVGFMPKGVPIQLYPLWGASECEACEFLPKCAMWVVEGGVVVSPSLLHIPFQVQIPDLKPNERIDSLLFYGRFP